MSLLTSPAPPSLLYIVVNASSAAERRALVCVPAKGGTTSFFTWLYEALSRRPWAFRDAPWPHEIKSARWRAVLGTTTQVARFSYVPIQKRRKVLADPATVRFALLREPLERAVSAFYSKIACEDESHQIHDVPDHKPIIRTLLRQAPTTARSLSAGSRPPSEYKVESRPPSEASSRNDSVPCLTAEDWSNALEEALNRTSAVDLHFMPQVECCGLRKVGYHHIVPLSDSEQGLSRLATHLGVLPAAFPHRHGVKDNRVRLHKRVGLTVSEELKPFGSAGA